MLFNYYGDSFDYKGNLSLLETNIIGIVGSRICRHEFLKIAHDVALTCIENNFTIASGLAVGIDTAVHNASLNKPSICCLPVNLDSCYPMSNLNIKETILTNQGLCLSLNKKNRPEKYDFLIRNRLLVNISHAIIIVNAERYSGTINTANEAIKQGKKLFVFDNDSSGNRYLIDRKNAASFDSVSSLVKLIN